ncbi:hypothetical protein FHY55_07105 [Oceanicola sp. D3]|uniref:hypothetical protein n=1 Tax=Oceanicola sp. D3 TaxID=2587163 RepID=UPI00111D74F2|nr:hypothetical protein [Oceanicola sp. D3]QDC09026.1 hypothetical protein FHY55_07105 [Oceanicola sp. D3]
MENVGDGPLAERPAARKTARLALAVGGVVFAGLLAWGLMAHSAGAERWFLAVPFEPLPPWAVALAALCVAMPLGTLAALIIGQRGHWGAALRPRLLRVIPAILLALITPVAMVTIFPIPMVLLLPALVEDMDPLTRALQAGAILLALGFWYLAAGLIASGVRSWGLRVAIFGQLWIGIYAGFLLFQGFNLFVI